MLDGVRDLFRRPCSTLSSAGGDAITCGLCGLEGRQHNYPQEMHGGRVVCNEHVSPQQTILTAKGKPTTCPDMPAALVTLLAKSSAIRTGNS